MNTISLTLFEARQLGERVLRVRGGFPVHRIPDVVDALLRSRYSPTRRGGLARVLSIRYGELIPVDKGVTMLPDTWIEIDAFVYVELYKIACS